MDSITSQVPLNDQTASFTGNAGRYESKTSKLGALSVTIMAADEEIRMDTSMAAVLCELFTFRED